jgi:uncharacterized damage-inducible protein DinB
MAVQYPYTDTMDILDRLIGHDAWTTRQLLNRSRELTPEQLNWHFDVGHGTLLETWGHLIGNIETWTELMSEAPITHHQPNLTLDDLIARHHAASDAFTALAQRIATGNRLDHLWTDVLDKPPQKKTYGGAIAHVLTHNHAHRTEILHMLERLGLKNLIEGDVLSWEQQARQ